MQISHLVLWNAVKDASVAFQWDHVFLRFRLSTDPSGLAQHLARFEMADCVRRYIHYFWESLGFCCLISVQLSGENGPNQRDEQATEVEIRKYLADWMYGHVDNKDVRVFYFRLKQNFFWEPSPLFMNKTSHGPRREGEVNLSSQKQYFS